MLVGVLFLFLSINLLRDFLQTGHLTGLLLLVSEALVVVLTVHAPPRHGRRSLGCRRAGHDDLARRPAARRGRRRRRRSCPTLATAALSAVGLCLVIAGKLALGRSFGLVPANRGVVASGPYLLVRHPIYSGYLITHVALPAGAPERVEHRRAASWPTRR